MGREEQGVQLGSVSVCGISPELSLHEQDGMIWEYAIADTRHYRFIRPTYTVTPTMKSLINEKEYNAIVAAAREAEK